MHNETLAKTALDGINVLPTNKMTTKQGKLNIHIIAKLRIVINLLVIGEYVSE